MPNEHHGNTLDSLFEELDELKEVQIITSRKVKQIQEEKGLHATVLTLIDDIRKLTPNEYVTDGSDVREIYAGRLLRLVEETSSSDRLAPEMCNPIDLSTWTQALALLDHTITEKFTSHNNGSHAFVSPCGDGSVHLNWIVRDAVHQWNQVRVEVWSDFYHCSESQEAEGFDCMTFREAIEFLKKHLINNFDSLET